MTLFIAALFVIFAPYAHADDDWSQWDKAVAPTGPSTVPSVDYNVARNYPAAGAPGTWQVYATPKGVHTSPTAKNWCGTVTSQSEIPALCGDPAIMDFWYR